MKLLEVGNLDGILVFVVIIMFGPAIILAIFGALLFKKNKKAAKVLFTMATIYIIISLGICGSMIA